MSNIKASKVSPDFLLPMRVGLTQRHTAVTRREQSAKRKPHWTLAEGFVSPLYRFCMSIETPVLSEHTAINGTDGMRKELELLAQARSIDDPLFTYYFHPYRCIRVSPPKKIPRVVPTNADALSNKFQKARFLSFTLSSSSHQQESGDELR